ncbi:MAG TPA: hypothetical protein VHS96_02940 [Bacteroidia bacterium]|nr:hypothetical protein [Bacteroidia bacterium]
MYENGRFLALVVSEFDHWGTLYSFGKANDRMMHLEIQVWGGILKAFSGLAAFSGSGTGALRGLAWWIGDKSSVLRSAEDVLLEWVSLGMVCGCL